MQRVAIFFTFFLLLANLSLIAHPLDLRSSVQTRSGFCKEGSSELNGTGLAFRAGDQILILGSERRGYSSSAQLFCHQVTFADGSKANAEFVSAEWGLGLFLWKIEANHAVGPARGLLSLEDISIGTLPAGSHIYRLGQTGAGRVLSPNSHRAPFPLASSLIEIAHFPIPFEAVGGAMTDAKGNWVGLLTNQYLKLVSGGVTQTEEWEPDQGSNEDNPVVLPAADAKTWVTNHFTSLPLPEFLVAPTDRRTKQNRIIYRDFAWEFSCLRSSNSRSANSHPIGGSVVEPGNDGVGIGGGLARHNYCELAHVQKLSGTEISALATQAAAPAPAGIVPIADALNQKSSVNIPFFIHPERGHSWKQASFPSPTVFFAKLRSPSEIPVVIADPPIAISPELFRLGVELRASSSMEFHAGYDLLYFRLRAAYFYQTATLLSSNQFSLVDLKELEQRVELKDPESRAYWLQYQNYYLSDPRYFTDHLNKWRRAATLARGLTP